MEETKKIDYIYVNKMYRYMKNDMQIETFMDKFHFSYSELIGLIELCKIYGKEINIENKNNILVFKKSTPKIINNTKIVMNLLIQKLVLFLIHTLVISISNFI